MAKILIPTALRQFTGGSDAVNVAGATVGEILGTLTNDVHPQLRNNLYTPEGKLRSFVNVYVNDEDIRYLDKDSTKVQDSDTVSIIPSIAGGTTAVETPAATALSNEEILRYSRHLIVPEVGMEGQLKLKQAKVLLVGAGGLGAPMGLYLAAAGVGTLGLLDFDVVDRTNLQRQVIHGTSDVGRKKIDSAEETIREINPNVNIIRHETALTSANALDIIREYDIVADGTDNFPTRYLVNDACVLLKKPNAYGSIFRFEGQASVFAMEDGPCYRCLYPEPPPPGLVPSCAEGGVLGILPGTIGLIQATEVVKLILGKGELLKGRLLLYDALNMRFRELKLRKNKDCPVCGEHPTVTELIDYQQFCGVVPQAESASVPEIDVVEVKGMLDRGHNFVLVDVREPNEFDIARIPTAKLIPLGDVPKRMNELNPGDEIVVHCRSGVRSAKAVDLLRQSGFRNVRNMRGGILAWSDKVDPSVPKY